MEAVNPLALASLLYSQLECGIIHVEEVNRPCRGIVVSISDAILLLIKYFVNKNAITEISVKRR